MNEDRIRLEMGTSSHNEAFARSVVAAFAARMNPTLEETEDIKTAVSEAVTNCIVHAYNEGPGKIVVEAWIQDDTLGVEVIDFGCGIEDVEKAMEPFFTTKPSAERSGIGFMIMGSFMDRLTVVSRPGQGTRVTMRKRICSQLETGEPDAQTQRV